MGDMDFSEAVKLEVKRKAGFQCCRCREFGVEIHHIIPQEFGGSNETDNAAPLCPNCHSFFGGNPDKRKEIRQMRDWWYQRIELMYPDNRQKNELEAISVKLDLLQQNQISLDDLKYDLYAIADNFISRMTLGTAVTTASAIVNASGSASASASASSSPSPEPPESE